MERLAASLHPGDLVVTKSSGSPEHLGKAAVVSDEIASMGCAFSNFMQRLRPSRGNDSKYLFWFLNSSLGRDQMNYFGSTTTGLRNLGASVLGDLVLPGASSDQQRAIAAFLDRKTAAIDALIAKKERLIELLQEKRQALITQAVTKGLDPNVPMKVSGIEWLGKIPAHWHLLPMKRRWQVIDCKHRSVPFVDEGVPVASIGEVHGFEIDLSGAKRTTRVEYLQLIDGGRRPQIGDVIYSRNATVGEAAYVASPEPFAMGQDVSLIRSRDQNQRFLVYVLRSPVVLRQIDAAMVGATFKRINVSDIAGLLVPCPPPVEQERIAGYCDRANARLGGILDATTRHLMLLREYRQALISAAVTGKIEIPAEEAA
jgi:type I restriction enzyme S subunit